MAAPARSCCRVARPPRGSSAVAGVESRTGRRRTWSSSGMWITSTRRWWWARSIQRLQTWTRASAVVEVSCCMSLSFGLGGAVAGRPWPGVPPCRRLPTRRPPLGSVGLAVGLAGRRGTRRCGRSPRASGGGRPRRPTRRGAGVPRRRPGGPWRGTSAQTSAWRPKTVTSTKSAPRSSPSLPRRAAPRGAAARPWCRRARRTVVSGGESGDQLYCVHCGPSLWGSGG